VSASEIRVTLMRQVQQASLCQRNLFECQIVFLFVAAGEGAVIRYIWQHEEERAYVD
jgi:hypothetical protein